MKSDVLLVEDSRLPKSFLLLFSLLFVALLFGVMNQIIYNEPMGSKPMSDTHLIVFTVICFAFLVSLFCVKSKLTIRENGFQIGLIPFFNGNIQHWESVKTYDKSKYSPFREAFGLGYRTNHVGYAFLGGRNLAIRILMKNDDKFLIVSRNQHRIIQLLEERSAPAIKRPSPSHDIPSV